MGGSSGGGMLGGIGEGLFGDGGAAAAGKAAMAQKREARRQYDEALARTEPVTVESLAQMDKALKYQERNLSRQEQLVSQIDPTIIEASQQALRLMRGDASSTLAPLQQQRDLQRQKLMNSLREQLGPGAETSTAGIQALTRFDAESGQLFSGAQQQALSNMGNIFGQFSSGKPDMLQQSAGYAGMAQNRAGLRYNQQQALSGALSGMYNSAGADYTKDVMRGQANAAFGKSLINAGATIGAAMLMPTPAAKAVV